MKPKLNQTHWLWLPLMLVVAVANVQAKESETSKLNQWLDEQYEQELTFSPIHLTFLGKKDLYDQVDDMSSEADEKHRRWLQDSVAEMEERFDYRTLDNDEQATYDFWKFRAEQVESGHRYQHQDYAIEQFDGEHLFPVEFLTNYHKVDTETDMTAYIARIKGFARANGQLLQRAQISAEKGVRPPRFAYEFVIEQSLAVITGSPFVADAETEATLWSDANAKITALKTAGAIDSDRSAQLQGEVHDTLINDFLPAYQAMIAWFEKDIGNTSAEAQGVHALPDGAAYYQRQLKYFTQSDMTADEVHELGLKEVGRLHDEIRGIMKQVGFNGSLQEFMAFVREDAQFYYPNTDEGREVYQETSRAMLEAVSKRLPEYFGLLPKAQLLVKRVEPYKELDGAAAFYRPGTPDGARAGVYYLHLSDMAALNRTGMETLAYHEGNPGHHMQSSIALEKSDMPMFRRNEWFSAYGEGWALYAEYLGKEMGGFSDPYSDYGRLNSESFRALRLVVDTGLHAKGWSEEQAVQYMLKNASYPEPMIRSEVRRYLVAPGQATSYKTGMLRILAMRQQAEEALGEKFSIRGFHDVILGGGALPLPILEKAVQQWVKSVKAVSM